jgi:hypothetical protein
MKRNERTPVDDVAEPGLSLLAGLYSWEGFEGKR